MASKSWRRVSLNWPPNQQQWEGLQQELDNLYRVIRAIQTNGVSGGSGGSADLTNLDADNLTSGTVPAARMPALTGDVTSGAGTVATTLSTTGVTAGSYGDGTHIPSFTVDAKGRLTAASSTAISNSTVVASVYRSTNQTLTHNTATAISLDTEHYDASNLWVVASPTKFTVPTGKDGVYTFKGQIALGTGFQGVALLQFAKNGTIVKSNTYVGADLSSGTEYHELTADIDLVATDYVEFKVTLVLAAGSGTFDVVGGTANTFMQAALCAPMTGDFGVFVKADGTVAFTGAQSMGSHKLTNVTDPTSAQDAATKAYVDGLAGLVLLEQHTAATSSALTFTTAFSNTYDEYVVELIDVLPASVSDLYAQVSDDGGSTWKTAANYTHAYSFAGSGGSSGIINSETDTAFVLAASNIATTSGEGVSGSMRITGLRGTGNKHAIVAVVFKANDGHWYHLHGMVTWAGASVINALKVFQSTGNIASGTVRVYGVKK